MKKILLLFLLVSHAVFAQVEHGALVGGNAVFPIQDEQKSFDYSNPSESYVFQNWVRPQITVGYRFRFLPKEKFFYDLDIRAGFQWTDSNHYDYSLGYIPDGNGDYWQGNGSTSFHEFLLPISVSASWNWHISKRFHVGAGIAPTLYVSPNAVFDLGVLAKVGYRVSKHLELGLTYQYGCLNTLKHFENDGKAGRRGHLSDLMLSVYVPFHL